ncbi:glycosyltransferase family 4 protein [Williamsia sp.]|uniref:glycosyltransferase family 4 protein n=1 Tax=Williamsia sp. TaxID=1872085 RepID=UPI001A234B2D|nr:glycosyltransferase family 4 protein [Williamsia sp.]MBJ7289902.1 glycosyltransferase family 4 protein [Williamsia sp.]
MHDAKMRMSRRRAGGAPKALIALSLAMRDELLQSSSGLPPVHVKYNSLEVDPGLGTHHGAAKTGYIWVGRLEAEKGFDLVVRTWRSWENPPPLTIVGDGKLADQARELSLASPHVEWTPRMEHQQVMTAIAEHRVSLITPLWSEPFGRVALESLAVGTPVVHTGKGALDELVGASGWKLDLRGDLRAQLSDFYEQAQATTGRARARYEGVLSPSATTKVLQSIYRTALEPGVH